MKKHRNIAVFVPHEGCPHMCAFCNQRSITGRSGILSDTDIYDSVRKDLQYHKEPAELAFFGGSFTAIEHEYMIYLLSAGKTCLDRGEISGIRISTRPDCINPEVLNTLKSYGVTAIELGAQSTDADVLKICERGHSPEDVINASKLINEFGYSLGLQMMTGLPGSSPEKDKKTAADIIDLSAQTARIYPCITLKGTKLAKMLVRGEYSPYSHEYEVRLCSELLLLFHNNGINVIKLGLEYSAELVRDQLAGNFHPAFRELCEGEIYLKKAQLGLFNFGISDGENIIEISTGEISKMIGHKKRNKDILNRENWRVKIIENPDLKPFEVKVNGKAVID